MLRMTAGTDLAPMAAVKQGGAGARRPARAPPVRPALGRRRPRGQPPTRRPRSTPRPAGSPGGFTWPAASGATITLRAGPPAPPQFGPAGRPPGRPSVEAADVRVRRTAEQSLADLAGLLLRRRRRPVPRGRQPVVPHPVRPRLPVGGPDAGARSTPGSRCPRCGCWPAGRGPATTRPPRSSPARSCTRSADAELRPAHTCSRRSTTAPSTPPRCSSAPSPTPTPGAPTRTRCATLLPAVRGCLGWLMAQSAGVRLAAVRRPHRARASPTRAGRTATTRCSSPTARLAEPPIALCEVQAYAYDAAVRGAALLEAFGEDPVPGPGRVGRRPARPVRATRSGSAPPPAATSRSPSTATAARSTR